MIRARTIGLCALLAGTLAGCAGAELQGKATGVRELIKTAEANGAKICAPVELATAEASVRFASNELDRGDYYDAKDHLNVADENAHAAVEKSPKEKCAPNVVVAEPKPKQIVVERVDTDKDGIYDDVDKCPNDPEDFDGFEDKDGCPDLDNDKDGIPDKLDKCPNDPEDKDGFEDADGCPDLDNDKDGLADGVDQCPNEPEDKDGFQDADGCPDPDNDKDGIPDGVDKCPNEAGPPPDGCPLVIVRQDKIELTQKIFFDFNKAKIKPVSFPLLNAVADAMKAHATIHVRIEGHTDSRGSLKHNMKLSQQRADSVRLFLIQAGVDGGRMESRGFGPTVPIDDNRTDAGREANRRVEFMITSP